MTNFPADNAVQSWHRYFAIENNNRAWELAALQSRTSHEDSEMLNAAHAAALHWNSAGTELNHMRAEMLLAEVHALMGFGNSAYAMAERVLCYFLACETADWEIAFAYTIHAHAAAVAGNTAQHRASYAAATSALHAIAEDEDRKLVMLSFKQVPQPDA